MTSDKNKHITDYLTYYFGLSHSPNYAVMITGPWGIGKTYIVKDYLRRFVEGKKKYVNVSLFGLSTIDEIDEAVFQAIYPMLAKKATKVGARVAKTLLKRAGFDPDFKLDEVLNKFNAEIYIFDDLERCEAPINKTLGYINQFVEHEGCKVLVIANEKDIFDDASYKKRREKLIGKTLEVQSAFDDAFNYFISSIDDPATKSLFKNNRPEVALIYTQSQLDNLRILQQTMWDFERFSSALTARHRKNSEAMTALLRLFFALSFELKAGRIGLDDLKARSGYAAAMALLNKQKTPLTSARERYAEIDLNDTLLSDDVLIDCLVRGIVNPDQIRASIDNSRFFVSVMNEPAWRTVWHWTERTNEEVEKAIKKMEKQFAAREFTISGEILHVLGLRLFLSDIGVLDTRAKLVAEGKQYIDDLYDQRRLQVPDDDLTLFTFNAYGGLGICENETAEYKELLACLRAKQQQVEKDTYPTKAANLLKEMERNPELFYRRVCITNSKESIYYGVPILAAIDPDAFVNVVLKMHPAHQRTVIMAFKGRYENGRLDRDLPDERKWAEAVRDKLVDKTKSMPPIAKRRLSTFMDWYITPVLK